MLGPVVPALAALEQLHLFELPDEAAVLQVGLEGLDGGCPIGEASHWGETLHGKVEGVTVLIARPGHREHTQGTHTHTHREHTHQGNTHTYRHKGMQKRHTPPSHTHCIARGEHPFTHTDGGTTQNTKTHIMDFTLQSVSTGGENTDLSKTHCSVIMDVEPVEIKNAHCHLVNRTATIRHFLSSIIM